MPRVRYHLRVLIVDDYEDNRTMLKFMLERKGMIIFEAANGSEGVEVACREHPDLILMDIRMPIMDGFEATRQLKQMNSTQDIPVLALSANCSDPNLHIRALEVGCIDCFSKPVEWGKIQTVIERL